ncbi:MAG TPA: acyltransferase [Spirochaetota bacterium]|nr:acyltransferase [Spirochaetota bacterium]
MKTRKSNIELLRIICMAVIVLNHYVSRRGIVETFDVFNFNNNIAHFFRSTGYPGLVAFVLISGYFMAGEGKFKTRRIVSLLVQVVAFTLICLLIGLFVLRIPCNGDMVIKSLIPYLYGYDAYWFVGPYLGMCLLAPFMDLLMDTCNIRQHKLFLLLSIILVFGISTNRSFSMSNERNGVLTFVILYTIAGYIKKYHLEDTITKSKLLIIMMSFWVLSYSTYPLGHLLKIELFNNMVLDMNNIFSLVIGVSFFMLFLKISINTNRVINYIAGTTFGIYLFHENFILREWIWGVAVNREAYYNSPLFVLHCFLTVSALFVIGMCFDIIISYIIKPVLNSAKVNNLCAGIDERINSSFLTAGEGEHKV